MPSSGADDAAQAAGPAAVPLALGAPKERLRALPGVHQSLIPYARLLAHEAAAFHEHLHPRASSSAASSSLGSDDSLASSADSNAWTTQQLGAFWPSLRRHSKARPDLIALETGRSVKHVAALLIALERQRTLSATLGPSHFRSERMFPSARQMSERWVALEEKMSGRLEERHDQLSRVLAGEMAHLPHDALAAPEPEGAGESAAGPPGQPPLSPRSRALSTLQRPVAWAVQTVTVLLYLRHAPLASQRGQLAGRAVNVYAQHAVEELLLSTSIAPDSYVDFATTHPVPSFRVRREPFDEVSTRSKSRMRSLLDAFWTEALASGCVAWVSKEESKKRASRAAESVWELEMAQLEADLSLPLPDSQGGHFVWTEELLSELETASFAADARPSAVASSSAVPMGPALSVDEDELLAAARRGQAALAHARDAATLRVLASLSQAELAFAQGVPPPAPAPRRAIVVAERQEARERRRQGLEPVWFHGIDISDVPLRDRQRVRYRILSRIQRYGLAKTQTMDWRMRDKKVRPTLEERRKARRRRRREEDKKLYYPLPPLAPHVAPEVYKGIDISEVPLRQRKHVKQRICMRVQRSGLERAQELGWQIHNRTDEDGRYMFKGIEIVLENNTPAERRRVSDRIARRIRLFGLEAAKLMGIESVSKNPAVKARYDAVVEAARLGRLDTIEPLQAAEESDSEVDTNAVDELLQAANEAPASAESSSAAAPVRAPRVAAGPARSVPAAAPPAQPLEQQAGATRRWKAIGVDALQTGGVLGRLKQLDLELLSVSRIAHLHSLQTAVPAPPQVSATVGTAEAPARLNALLLLDLHSHVSDFVRAVLGRVIHEGEKRSGLISGADINDALLAHTPILPTSLPHYGTLNVHPEERLARAARENMVADPPVDWLGALFPDDEVRALSAGVDIDGAAARAPPGDEQVFTARHVFSRAHVPTEPERERLAARMREELREAKSGEKRKRPQALDVVSDESSLYEDDIEEAEATAAKIRRLQRSNVGINMHDEVVGIAPPLVGRNAVPERYRPPFLVKPRGERRDQVHQARWKQIAEEDRRRDKEAEEADWRRWWGRDIRVRLQGEDGEEDGGWVEVSEEEPASSEEERSQLKRALKGKTKMRNSDEEETSSSEEESSEAEGSRDDKMDIDALSESSDAASGSSSESESDDEVSLDSRSDNSQSSSAGSGDSGSSSDDDSAPSVTQQSVAAGSARACSRSSSGSSSSSPNSSSSSDASSRSAPRQESSAAPKASPTPGRAAAGASSSSSSSSSSGVSPSRASAGQAPKLSTSTSSSSSSSGSGSSSSDSDSDSSSQAHAPAATTQPARRRSPSAISIRSSSTSSPFYPATSVSHAHASRPAGAPLVAHDHDVVMRGRGSDSDSSISISNASGSGSSSGSQSDRSPGDKSSSKKNASASDGSSSSSSGSSSSSSGSSSASQSSSARQSPRVVLARQQRAATSSTSSGSSSSGSSRSSSGSSDSSDSSASTATRGRAAVQPAAEAGSSSDSSSDSDTSSSSSDAAPAAPLSRLGPAPPSDSDSDTSDTSSDDSS